ncbi:MAG: L-lactate permease, partial [Thermoleophilaceae bacterium]|nr:L-lactate permease [Thermoleophilaceae bacterium]
MSYAVGAAPFAVAAVALLVLRWSAGRAGAATLAAAALGALLSPDLEAGAIPGSLAEGAAICARVLVILFGGLLLHNVLSRGGAVGEVTRFLDRVEPDREALALLVVLGVGPFFESVTGFGLAVVIGAPILLAAGFDPLRAAVLACWSQCAVPWGALGVGTTVGADLSGLGFGELSDVSALLSLPLFALYGLASLVLAGGAAAVRRHGAEALGLGLLAGGATLAVSVLLVPELSGALAAALAAGVFLLRRRRRLRELRPPVRAVAPYALLLILLVVATGPPAVQAAIESLGPALTGPAPWLFLSALAAAALLAVTPA